MLAGESIFLNHFTANGANQEVLLAPALVGDVDTIDLDGTLMIQGSSWLGSASDIDVDMSFKVWVRPSLAVKACSGSSALAPVRSSSTALAASMLKLMATTPSILATSLPLMTALNGASAKPAHR